MSLFDDTSNFEERFIQDYLDIRCKVHALKELGMKVVLTSGTFDLIHEGHSRYLEAARNFGDFLVVGVDSDQRVKQRKGPSRPVVPHLERARMVAHQRGVGIVTLKHPSTDKWVLPRAIRPDTVVVTEDANTAEELHLLHVMMGQVEIKVLPRMATTSTSARIRDLTLARRDEGL